jgi:putative ABC transport system permease protein
VNVKRLTAVGLPAVVTVLATAVAAILLADPLDFRDARELVVISPGGRSPVSATGVHVHAWRQALDMFSETAVLQLPSSSRDAIFDLMEGPSSRRLLGARVTWNLFDLLGCPMAAGRRFEVADSGRRALILSYGAWRDLFAGRMNAIGGRLLLNDSQYDVVGVASVNCLVPESPALFTAMALDDIPATPGLCCTVVGRLKPDVPLALAVTRVADLEEEIGRAYSPRWSRRIELTRLRDLVFSAADTRLSLLLLGLATALTAAAYVNLLIWAARDALRSRYAFAVQLALGATNNVILKRHLRASLLACLAAALVGAIAAAAVVAAMQHSNVLVHNAYSLSRAIAVAVLLAVFASLTATAVTAAFMARSALRRSPVSLLRSSPESAVGSTVDVRARWLIGAQLCLVACICCIGVAASALYVSLRVNDMGFSPTGLWAFEVRVLDDSGSSQDRLRALRTRLSDAVRSVPGVVRVGAASAIPLRGPDGLIMLEGDFGILRVHWRTVDHTYFDALGLDVFEGRPFTDRDGSETKPVAIVSRSLADRLGGGAIGRFLELKGQTEVVGVVDDVAWRQRGQTDAPTIYTPFDQSPPRIFTLLVRADASARRSIPAAVQAAVSNVEPRQPLERVASFEAIIEQARRTEWLQSRAAILVSLLALVLLVAGAVGVVEEDVTARGRELWIKMALGATGPRVAVQVAGGYLLVAVVGIAVGTAAAAIATGFAPSVLPGAQLRSAVMSYVLTATCLLLGSLVIVGAAALHAANQVRSGRYH